MFFLQYWLIDKFADWMTDRFPVENKRTELPFSLSTRINLAVVPLGLLALAGLIYSRY